MSKDVVAFVIGIHEVKKEQAEIGSRTKVENNKDIIRI